jgi:hypothetical protein
MTNSTYNTSLRTAALIAGLAILTVAIVAPIAELILYPKLVVTGKAAETAKNIIENLSPLYFIFNGSSTQSILDRI